MFSVRRNFLEERRAERLAELFADEAHWEPVSQTKAYSDEFRQFPGRGMPYGTERYLASFERSEKLEQATDVLAATDLIGGTNRRCYQMTAGDGFRIHDDSYFGGTRSHVLYLNKDWRWDWGGLLHVLSDEGRRCDVIYPEFNTLVTLDYSVQTVPHFVSQVAHWALEPRYVLAVFGGTRKVEAA